MPSYEPVRSLVRGLKVLRVLNERSESNLSEITVAVDFPKATVVRILETLEYCGYVARDPSTGRFFATGRTLMLSRGYNSQRAYRDIAQPMIESLHREIGWPLNLGAFDHDAMVILYTNRESLSGPSRITTGYRSPVSVTSLGRAYLAFSEEDVRENVLRVLRDSNAHWEAQARNIDAMRALLAEVRRVGYALSDPAYLQAIYNSSIWAVAVPVMDGSRVDLCLSVMVSTSAMDQQEGIQRLVPALRRCAEQISARLRDAAPVEEQGF